MPGDLSIQAKYSFLVSGVCILQAGRKVLKDRLDKKELDEIVEKSSEWDITFRKVYLR